MSLYKIAVADGDGIGPEIVNASLEILNFLQDNLLSGVKFDFQKVNVGWKGVKDSGISLSKDTLKQIGLSDALILGPLSVGTYPESDPGSPSPSGKIRKYFDLFANIRPTVSYSLNDSYPEGQVDFVIVRENTEGFYADRNMFLGNGEYMPTEDVALSVRVITRFNSTRVIKEAFHIAKTRRNKVTAVHKNNVLKITDGLFMDAFRSVSQDFPEVETNDKIVDAMAFDILKRPQEYDVVVTTNMYGDILSDEAAGIPGSLGLSPSLNSGEKFAMAQAVHGSAPDIAGKGIANPIGEILSCGMLLEWLERKQKNSTLKLAADTLSLSVRNIIKRRENLTPDLGGRGKTELIVKMIKETIERVNS